MRVDDDDGYDEVIRLLVCIEVAYIYRTNVNDEDMKYFLSQVAGS